MLPCKGDCSALVMKGGSLTLSRVHCPCPLVARREAGPGPPRLGCLALSWASVLLSDLNRLRAHRPLPRGMRSSCWQQRYLLASGPGCGKGAALVVLAVVIFSRMLGGDSLADRYSLDALAWHQGIRKQEPPDTPWGAQLAGWLRSSRGVGLLSREDWV